MSDVTEELDWDDVLGEVEKEEKKNPDKPQGDFEALPKGPYTVVVQEADKQVSTTGKDMIKARVQVTDGPYANRVLFNYFVFGTKTDTTLNRITLGNLAAFGVTREFIATQKPSIATIAEALVGRKATAIVGIQDSGDYKGRNEIKSFRPLEGATQPAPQVASPPAAGVPNIPKPAAETSVPTPSVPVPEVPAGSADAADPFEG